MNKYTRAMLQFLPTVAIALLGSVSAWADVVTDWNVTAADTVFAATMGAPPSNRTLAIVQTAVYEAVNAITKRYPADHMTPNAAPETSIDAAVAAANRAALVA